MGHFANAQLSSVVTPIERSEIPIVGQPYRQAGVRLWGQGAYEREMIDGGETQYRTLNRVALNDIIVNKIWARNGSVSVILEDIAGCYVSSEFPLFQIDDTKLFPRWFFYLTKTPDFWRQCEEKSFGTSGKNRIRPEKFLEIEIPLPPLDEQQRIVAYLDAIAEKIALARINHAEIDDQLNQLLLGTFSQLTDRAQLLQMKLVAPIVRRPVQVEFEKTYHELGIRSFGNGTFHKSPITGAELGSKRVFQIEPGDLLFSNVFAWEGAIAVARSEDAGRIGSHRFISCVAQDGIVSAEFLCFYFLTHNGLGQIGEASPGGAGRNRTLGLDKLERILVPVPSYKEQLWFNTLQRTVNKFRRLRADITAELDKLLPSLLDRAFKGELFSEAPITFEDAFGFDPRPWLQLAFLSEKKQPVLITDLMKLNFLRQEEFNGLSAKPYQFEAHYYGPSSAAVNGDLDALKRDGLITIRLVPNKKRGYRKIISLVAAKHNEIQKHIAQLPPVLLNSVQAAIKKYGDYDQNRLLDYVYENYSEYTTKSRRIDTVRRAKKRRQERGLE